MSQVPTPVRLLRTLDGAAECALRVADDFYISTDNRNTLYLGRPPACVSES